MAQRVAFFEMLKSVQLTGASAASPPTQSPPIKLPEGWTQVEPGPMQVAKFIVPEKDGAKADVAISIFPNDTGGTAANIKRWRDQLGLPAVDDATAEGAAKPLEGASPGSLVVDLENAGRAMVSIIVPREGEHIFFKLTGDAAAVAAAREAFVAFVKGTP